MGLSTGTWQREKRKKAEESEGKERTGDETRVKQGRLLELTNPPNHPPVHSPHVSGNQ